MIPVYPDGKRLGSVALPDEQDRRFIELVAGSCLSPIEAAAEVGFTDPAEAVRRLFGRPAVVREIVLRFQAESLPWRALLAKAKLVLWRNMDSEREQVAGDAARTVMAAAKRNDMSLAESAAAEDRMDRSALADEVLSELVPPKPTLTPAKGETTH